MTTNFNKYAMRKVAQERNREFYNHTVELYRDDIDKMYAALKEQIKEAAKRGQFHYTPSFTANRFPTGVSPKERQIIISEIIQTLKSNDFVVKTMELDYGDRQYTIEW